MGATYFVLIDWNANDSFADAYEDVSTAVRHAHMPIKLRRGRDGRFAKPRIGSCEFALHDPDGDYTPSNTGSPISPNVKLGREVYIYARVDGQANQTLFKGYIDEIIPRQEVDQKVTIIRCNDTLGELEETEVSLAVQENQEAGTIVIGLLDAAVWESGKRSIEAFDEAVPWFWAYKQDAYSAIQSLMDSTLGLFYCDHAGQAVYESRHARLKDTLASGTIDSTTAARTVEYRLNRDDVVNRAEIVYVPRSEGGTATLWKQETSIYVPAGSAAYSYGTVDASLWVETSFSAPAVSVVSPVGTTDFLANSHTDQTGTDLTGDIAITVHEDRGQGALLKVVNSSGTPGYFVTLQVRGTPLEEEEPYLYTEQDETSQDDYRLRAKRLGGPFGVGKEVAKDLADYHIQTYADPLPDIMVNMLNVNDTVWDDMLQYEISDRLRVVYSPHSIDADYVVEGVDHDISEGYRVHRTKLVMSPANTVNYWILETHGLGTAVVGF
jgi:hypothetical protein